MDEIDVKRLLELEINRVEVKETNHGHIDIQRIHDFLVATPYKKQFIIPVDGSVEFHWVVLDEDKNSRDKGYLVLYSETDAAFGLGTKTTMKGTEAGTLLGIFGPFMVALDSM